MKLRKIFAVALIGTGLAASAQAKSWTFDVAPGDLLEVDLEPGGDVEIRGESGSTVTIETTRDLDGIEFDVIAMKTARGVKVRAELDTRFRSRTVDAGLVITVPYQFDLDLESSGGGFTIVDVDGRIEGETKGGGIELQRVKGEIALETMGGAVTASDVDARGKVETMGGPLRFNNVRGGLGGSTMGGAVSLEGGGPVELSTMGGRIRVKSAPEGAKVSTMGGQVDVDSAHAPFKASTMGGDLSARIDGGDGDVELSSMGGNVEVWLPGGFDMEIEAEIVQTRGRDGAYTIDSDFPLEKSRDTRSTREKGGRSWSNHDREVVWHGVGRVGDGRNRVRISTFNGDIRIRSIG